MTERTDHDLLIEIHTDLKHVKSTITDIPAQCAAHKERLNRVEADIESLWDRWWWAIATGVSALIAGILALAKSALGK